MARNKVDIMLLGVDEVINSLNEKLQKIGNKSMRSLIKAAVLIRRDMDKSPPVVPVDLGNLRASIFIFSGSTKELKQDANFVGQNSGKLSADHNTMVSEEMSAISGKKLVSIGVSASYAEEVEYDTSKKRKRPGSGGGWFRSAIARNEQAIVKMVKKDSKI